MANHKELLEKKFANQELVLLGSVKEISNIDKIIFNNLKKLEIRPKDVPLSVALYKGNKLLVYPSDPSKPIQGISSCSKQNKGYSGKLGFVEYFPCAFEKDNKDYGILILFKNPLSHYLNCLEEAFPIL